MKKIKLYCTVFVLIAFVAYWGWIFISRGIKNHQLKNNSKEVKAVIINERNYMGNSPVSQQYSYSYQFKIDGKTYTGDSMDPKFKINDTILVKYVKDRPEMNEPVELPNMAASEK